jgi:hypothetical protein
METINIHSNSTDTGIWWNETDFSQMERITGFRQSDFDPKDGYRAFVDACDNWWEALDTEEKTEIWMKYN